MVFIRVEDATSSCYSIVSMELILDRIPNVPLQITEVFAVSDEDGDGVAIFDLRLIIPNIIGSQTDLVVSFFTSEVDAQNETAVIENPETFINTTNPQTLYARTETVYGNFAVTEFVVFADESLHTISAELDKISFYPNPVENVLHLKLPSLNDELTVAVVNMNGQQLVSKTYSPFMSSSISLNMAHLASGLYFLKMSSNNQQVVKKIMMK